jgi:hypothetical protein
MKRFKKCGQRLKKKIFLHTIYLLFPPLRLFYGVKLPPAVCRCDVRGRWGWRGSLGCWDPSPWLPAGPAQPPRTCPERDEGYVNPMALPTGLMEPRTRFLFAFSRVLLLLLGWYLSTVPPPPPRRWSFSSYAALGLFLLVLRIRTVSIWDPDRFHFWYRSGFVFVFVFGSEFCFMKLWSSIKSCLHRRWCWRLFCTVWGCIL